MNKLIMTLVSLALLSGSVSLAAVTSAQADNCVTELTVCPVVPETNYNGTNNVSPKIEVLACFDDEETAIITRPDGTNEWVVNLIYSGGNGLPDRIATMHNTNCRSQFVTPGTKIAVYVTCPEYTGWVMTEAIHTGGTKVMQRVAWDFDPTK